ncbi:uncharacterized protein HRG_02535 [Hirsutella rhossiliensis]|uniref:Heterokaryon incompatibility domain-containing protein n=1 Tax=Hirsutella rhossiliensis TaxID=111463 RepID=A0A9P8SLN1_9HYPO|nr:uncharacterized protein HRG_02535 [Hirsutella rhossiliensis]KAH0967126.1 hypothetical protein HRG_02535 [Hirsutella rhossiliensis]
MDAQKISVGLPRFNENVKCRPQKAALVRNRRWNTRGWTYQELLLSRRLLFFTDSQVYFQCMSNLWNPGGPSEGGLQLGSLHLKRWPFRVASVQSKNSLRM